MSGTTVTIDHAKMKAVVARIDKLLGELDSRGHSGSYSGMQDAAMLAQAVCSVNQKEMGELVDKYNKSFGQAANEYQNFCQVLVEIRNAVAQTSNIHLANDDTQASDFKPLEVKSWASEHHSGSGSSHSSTPHTTVEAPGPLGSSTRPSAPSATEA